LSLIARSAKSFAVLMGFVSLLGWRGESPERRPPDRILILSFRPFVSGVDEFIAKYFSDAWQRHTRAFFDYECNQREPGGVYVPLARASARSLGPTGRGSAVERLADERRAAPEATPDRL
jgi:hypothetical protein